MNIFKSTLKATSIVKSCATRMFFVKASCLRKVAECEYTEAWHLLPSCSTGKKEIFYFILISRSKDLHVQLEACYITNSRYIEQVDSRGVIFVKNHALHCMTVHN